MNQTTTLNGIRANYEDTQKQWHQVSEQIAHNGHNENYPVDWGTYLAGPWVFAPYPEILGLAAGV